MTYGYMAPDGASVNQMLGEGASGLKYFEELLPRYKKACDELGLWNQNVPSLPDYSVLDSRYYAEKDMNFERLRSLQSALGRAVDEGAAQIGMQDHQLRNVPSVWPEGDAAAEGLSLLTDQVIKAKANHETAKGIETELDIAVTQLHGLIKRKAELVSIYWDPNNPRVDGQSVSEVDNHIARAKQYKSNHPDVSIRIGDAVGGAGTGGGGDGIQADSYAWVKDVFVPQVIETTLTSFGGMYEDTADKVREIYRILTTRLNELTDTTYRVPVEKPQNPSQGTQPSNGQPAGPGPGQPNSASPAGTPAPTEPSETTSPSATQAPSTADPATTNPAATNPATTNPTSTAAPKVDGLAALSQVAQQLSSSASGLTQSLNQGITALSGVIKTGVDGAIEKLQEVLELTEATKDESADEKSADEKSADEKSEDAQPMAEFDLGNKHVEVEMGGDGQLKLVVSEDNGTVREFMVELDERGVPVVSTGDGSTPAPADEKPETPAPGHTDKPVEKIPVPGNTQAPEKDPAPGPIPSNPGVAAGVPPNARGEEDGEHYPRPVPAPEGQQSASSSDSGAELAEAGPLGAELAEAGPL